MLIALGGLAILILGLKLLSEALSALLGGSARRILTAATANPLRAWLAGVVVGALSLNSSALSLTAIGLAEAGITPFATALVLGLAAKAGATVALQLAATPLSAVALPIVGVGYLLSLWSKAKSWGEMLIGLGLLLLGINLMVQNLLPAMGSELFRLVRQSLEANPLGLWVLGFALAALLGSANAVAALALALVGAKALTLAGALALMLGGGAGSGFLLVLTRPSGAPLGRRIAWAHVGWKTLLSGIFLLLMGPFASVSQGMAGALGLGVGGAVVQAHTLYHLLASLLVLPLLRPLEALMHRLIPDTAQTVSPKYLSTEALTSRELASSLALREVSRVGDQLAQMLAETVRILSDGHGNAAEVARREEKVDQLTRAVVLYLSELSSRHPGEAPLMLMIAASEIEHMGDQVRRILRMQNKLYQQHLEFSSEGRAELAAAAERTYQRLRLALAALATRNTALADQVLAERQEMERYLLDLRRSHLLRLERGRVESKATTLAHLDLLIVLEELDQSLTRLAALARDLDTPALGGHSPAPG
ncbi:PhoU family protein [Allomeiothermus silvanus DSM 9946]|uniref:PhoU family protein n=1 Tax=Allomeiothermus silvanus (strain ATCC 700542 / DSM 9946 / NBRC 106475 / NCIMB 13440 / VI-R2) TaxID=526227 RepID=D7BGL0_ALLS1|nr:Na/Pi symporter [Allomeiothermus silvanus]ADH63826.1 PhoU family protein [Allomeiothermus silvanus DSM 9946]